MPGIVKRSRRISSPHPLLGFGGRDKIQSAALLASSVPLGGVNEVKTVTITGTPTGGTFTLTFGGQTTSAIAYNAAGSAVEDAVEALSSVGLGNVRVTGGPGPGTPYVITFLNDLGRRDVGTMTAAHSFTGGTTPAIAVTTTTEGDATDGQRFILHRGVILKKSGSKVIPWGGTGTIFGVLARDVELFDQSSVSDTDVNVYSGPGCTFDSAVLALYSVSGYVGNEAAFATWANGRGNVVGTQS